MTTTAQTWFYNTPEDSPYLIAERVRTNFWDARFGGLWLDTVRAEPPILMRGTYNGSDVEMEWHPGQWLILRAKPASEALAQGVTNVIGFKPAFKYDDPHGYAAWEWHLGDLKTRWQIIQGRPDFGRLERLK